MDLLRTPFFEHHKAAGGRLIDFGGWELPVQYSDHGRTQAGSIVGGVV